VWEAAAIWENACRLLLPGASRRVFAQRLLLQEPVCRLHQFLLMVYILSQQFYELIKNVLFFKANPSNLSTQAEVTISSGDPEVLLEMTKFIFV